MVNISHEGAHADMGLARKGAISVAAAVVCRCVCVCRCVWVCVSYITWIAHHWTNHYFPIIYMSPSISTINWSVTREMLHFRVVINFSRNRCL